jgi:hypothetical protein
MKKCCVNENPWAKGTFSKIEEGSSGVEKADKLGT